LFPLLMTCAWLTPEQRLDAASLEVGPGKQFRRIEAAHDAAQPGDVILIFPSTDNPPYAKTAVYVRKPRLTFRGVPGPGQRWVRISGQDFDYSGRGSTPRAIFQFNADTDHCTVEGLELSDAHNSSQNGAGVRISQANHVTIRNCSIHDNDMGVMSGGDGSLERGVNQRFEHCEVHHNGNQAHAGYNHNFYLGGTSVTLRFCEIHHSLTGHNVKSRAHHTRVEYCYVHDSLNREFDLVDARDTTYPDSHAVLLGNIIAKDTAGRGNRTVIHFGQDGGQEHDGTLHLAFNTVVTPFIAPVVDLSASKARAQLIGNLVTDGGTRQAGQTVAACRDGAVSGNVQGTHNWFSGGFGGPRDTKLDPATNRFDRAEGPLFLDAAALSYHLRPDAARQAAVRLKVAQIALPAVPGSSPAEIEPPLTWQYHHPLGKEPRPVESPLTRGAYAAAPE
jgi:hypothetical protein